MRSRDTGNAITQAIKTGCSELNLICGINFFDDGMNVDITPALTGLIFLFFVAITTQSD